MSHWTDSARDALEQFLKDYQNALLKSGDTVDVAEVLGDLRRHVQQELGADRFSVVTEVDVRRVLARIGLPNNPLAGTVAPVPTPAPESKPPSRWRIFFLVLFGVALPAISLLAEVALNASAEIYLDPIPNWIYLLLVAAVPIVNARLCFAVATLAMRISPAWYFLSGIVLVAEVFYTVLFVPIIPFACIGILYFGLGFLPLAPLIGLIVTIRLLYHLRSQGDGVWPVKNGYRIAKGGILAGLVLVILFVTPWLSFHWTRQAAEAESPAAARNALKLLRLFGDDDLLLRACYSSGGRSGSESVLGNLLMGGQPPDSETARRVYFQVTGRAFNSVPAPQRNYGAARWNYLDDWAWDDDHGGTAVAARIKGLSLHQSRMDALANVENGWCYLEWIMEFKNTSKLDREARAQILLPPEAVVSRLTLWINGEEREAAFAGAAEVRAAYQEVAVRQRRDPVLVTWSGKDRVLMQCFPVPRQGGTMKVRIGITAPWALEATNQAHLRLPHFLERNFQLSPELKHSVWLEATGRLEGNHWLIADRSATNKTGLHGEIADAQLSTVASVIHARNSTPNMSVQADDYRTRDGTMVKQTIVSVPNTRPARIILLLDGGVDMAASVEATAAALLQLPLGTAIAAVIAKDGSIPILPPTVATAEVLAGLQKQIRQLKCEGGQDNLTAMLQALDWAMAATNSVIVWIHGPQPVSLDKTESLRQRLVWRPHSTPAILDVQVLPGPNRLAELPELSPYLTSVLRQANLSDDLRACFAQWGPASSSRKYARQRIEPPAPTPITEPKGPNHVVRLWASEEISRLLLQNQRSQAVALAARYQLVTPVSGAVVLESQAQYERAGLQPVAATTVPSVPEPSTWIIALAGLLFFAWMRRRTKYTPPSATPAI